MATKFIGYKRKNGSFLNDKTGEVVNYDNFDLYFITGGVPEVTGFYPSSYKIKASAIRQILDYPADTPTETVIETLKSYVNKDVLLSVLNVEDKPVVTGLVPVPPKSTVSK